jgi:hypothetical protein
VDVTIVFGTLPLETEKTITVTVTKTNFNDGKLHITTADVSTPGKLNHLAFVFRRRKISSRGNTKCSCKCLE